MENFAINFKRLRESMNYTQDYVAYQLGVPLQILQSWENGESMPNSSVLPRIANLFCCSIDLLFQNPNEIDTGKTAYTLFSKGPLTRRKVRNVMYNKAIGGIVGGILGIIVGTVFSVICLTHEFTKPFAAGTLLVVAISLFNLIYSSKLIVNIKNDKLDIKTKRRSKTNEKEHFED